jgi:cytochrome c oxidase subunit 4
VAVEERREVEPAAHHAAGDRAHRSGHPSAKEYVRIGVILAVLTALEVAASYAGVSGAILIPTLLVLALVKFALVVLWFMHLKFDDRRYARFFVVGLSGAAILYLIVLISFRTFL